MSKNLAHDEPNMESLIGPTSPQLTYVRRKRIGGIPVVFGA